MTQDRQTDSEFDAYLKGKSGLSDAYAGLPEPKLPDHLDAAILAEARRAVGARPGGRPRRSWMIPLSLAASLFVVVIIGAQLPYLLKEPNQPPPAREDKLLGGKAELDEFRARANKQAAPAAPAPAAPAQVPQEAPGYNKLQVEAGAVAPRAKTLTAPGGLPEPERQAAKPSARAYNQPEAAPAAPAATMAAPAAQETMRMEQKVQARQAQPGQSQTGTALKKEKRPSAEAGEEMELNAVANAPQAESLADEASPQPEEWLARIRKLKKQGKLDEAKKELTGFRKRFPDYAVPADLKDLLSR